MSGICALWNRDGKPMYVDAIRRMVEAARHRGPDGMWVHQDGALGWGFAKLTVSAEDAGEHQPIVSPRTQCVIVADVRLDNRDYIINRLPDRPLVSESDAELILRAYEAWGLEALPRLIGDFAFLIWNPQCQNMIAARDTSGQRSLYYRLTSDRFEAASEIQQLLQDPSVAMEPNEDRIRNFLTPSSVFGAEKDGPATFYSGICTVPAGKVLVVDYLHSHLRTYWQFPVGAEIRYHSADEYADHFRELLYQAVLSRIRSVHPVACLLSGGLDSSSVVCSAHELYRAGRAENHGFVAISSVFEGQSFDERLQIQEMQRKYGFYAEFVPSSAEWGRRELALRGFQERPYLASLALLDKLMAKVAANGARVLLSGDVADSCVGGSWLVFDTLIREGRIRSALHLLDEFRRGADERLRTVVSLYCLTPFLPISMQRAIHVAYARRAIRRVWNELVPSWLASNLAEDLRCRHVEAIVGAERARKFASPTRETEYRLLYPPVIVPSRAPWSIQPSQPYADRRLHEFLLSIPPTQKFDPDILPGTEFYGRSKLIVRRALRGIVPDEIRTRVNKTVFAWEIENDYAQQWNAYESLFGPGANPEAAIRGYVSQPAFYGRLRELRDGARGADSMLVSRIIALEVWLRGLRLSRSKWLRFREPLRPDTT